MTTQGSKPSENIIPTREATDITNLFENEMWLRATSTVPTGIPRHPLDKQRLYVSGSTIRLYAYDSINATWRIVGGSSIGLESRVVLASSTNTTVPDTGSFTTVVFDVEVMDNLGEWDTSTSTFTATYDGGYIFSPTVAFNDGQSSVQRKLRLYKNGSAAGSTYYTPEGVEPFFSGSFTYLIPLSAGDTVQLKIAQDSTPSFDTLANSSFMSIWRIY